MLIHSTQVAKSAPLVLIVEDNDDGRETLLALLRVYGFRAEAAADGAEGVIKGLTLQPVAAIVDIGLPILDGFDVARELRRLLGGSVLLIAHTAYTSEDYRQRAAEAGFDYFLAKPLEVEELLSLLEEAVN
jgi:CheY-like chemotaxis protein